MLLAFFLPPVSCLTYVMFTDNSRLSMLLFWTSVLAFQRWAQKSSPWHGLALPMALYVGSFLTYETSGFLIFVVPLLVWPVHRRCSDRPSDRAFLIKLCIGILAAFAAAVALRFVSLNGGAVGHSYLLPPFELLWSYLALLPFYLLAPFTSMSADRWALLAGFLVVLGTAGLFLFSSRDRSAAEVAAEGRFEPGSQWYLVVLGAGDSGPGDAAVPARRVRKFHSTTGRDSDGEMWAAAGGRSLVVQFQLGEQDLFLGFLWRGHFAGGRTKWVAEAVSQAARKDGGPGYHRFHGGFSRGIEPGLERGSGNPQQSRTESGQSGS